MTKNKFRTVSPLVRMFMAEVKTLKYDEELYFKRANVRKAFKRYCIQLGINFNQLAPQQFYREVLVYLNEQAPHLISLDRVKCYDVFSGVTCEEFYGENDVVGYDKITAFIDGLAKPLKG